MGNGTILSNPSLNPKDILNNAAVGMMEHSPKTISTMTSELMKSEAITSEGFRKLLEPSALNTKHCFVLVFYIN